ncbi:MAG: hypothetical protein ACRDNL_20410 [Spirillospora sp.]
MKLLSVNIGKPRADPWSTAAITGIDKRPAAASPDRLILRAA